MPFAVLLTHGAAKDLADLYEYIGQHDAPGKADYVLTQIENTFSNLSESPDRGVHPKELLRLGIRDFREIFFKPYRVSYNISCSNIYIMLIVDGRRDLQELLQRRIWEA